MKAFQSLYSGTKITIAKKILINGGTGFIGSHLMELCVEQGFDVVVFDRYNSNRSFESLIK